VLVVALTVSRTGLFALVIAGATALLVARRRLVMLVAVVYPLLVVLPIVGLMMGGDTLGNLVDHYVFRYSREETDSPTGGFDVWAEAADLIAARPFTGYGYVAGPRVELSRRLPAWSPMHAHNAWLQAALDVGLIGGIAFALSTLGFAGLALAGIRSLPGQN